MTRFLVASVLIVGLLVGCASQPTTTPPPPRASSPSGEPVDSYTVGLMVDQMAQTIVNELPATQEVMNSPYRQSLAIGPIEVAGFSEPERFQTALESLRTKVMQNGAMRDSFDMISTSRSDADTVMTDLAGGSTDRYTDPLTGDSVARIDPRDLLLMTGRFHRFGDGPTRQGYRLMVFVEQPQSQRRIWSQEFDRHFVWDERAGRWRALVE